MVPALLAYPLKRCRSTCTSSPGCPSSPCWPSPPRVGGRGRLGGRLGGWCDIMRGHGRAAQKPKLPFPCCDAHALPKACSHQGRGRGAGEADTAAAPPSSWGPPSSPALPRHAPGTLHRPPTSSLWPGSPGAAAGVGEVLDKSQTRSSLASTRCGPCGKGAGRPGVRVCMCARVRRAQGAAAAQGTCGARGRVSAAAGRTLALGGCPSPSSRAPPLSCCCCRCRPCCPCLCRRCRCCSLLERIPLAAPRCPAVRWRARPDPRAAWRRGKGGRAEGSVRPACARAARACGRACVQPALRHVHLQPQQQVPSSHSFTSCTPCARPRPACRSTAATARTTPPSTQTLRASSPGSSRRASPGKRCGRGGGGGGRTRDARFR